MNSIIKFSKLIVETDGKFVRSDGFPSDPLNTKRVINTSKLCKDILEAKDFYKFPEDLRETLKAFPNAKKFNCNFDLTYDKHEKH
jgi:hypothetical protein